METTHGLAICLFANGFGFVAFALSFVWAFFATCTGISDLYNCTVRRPSVTKEKVAALIATSIFAFATWFLFNVADYFYQVSSIYIAKLIV